MKKTLLFLFFIHALGAAAQRHPYVEARGGLSLPLFDYAATNLTKGSFATAGFTAGVAAGFPFRKHWMVVAEASYYTHAVDVSTLGYEKVKADPFLLDVTIRSEPFRILSFMAGLGWNTRLTRNLTWESSLMAGYFASRSPYQLYKPTYFMTGPPYYEITTSLDRSLAWGMSSQLSYALTPCYSIGLGAHFLQSDAAFQFRTTDGNIRTDKRTISMLNFQLGILFKLPAIQAKTKQ